MNFKIKSISLHNNSKPTPHQEYYEGKGHSKQSRTQMLNQLVNKIDPQSSKKAKPKIPSITSILGESIISQ